MNIRKGEKMKKLLPLLLIVLLFFTGCAQESPKQGTEEGNFHVIKELESDLYLVADNNTKIVYYFIKKPIYRNASMEGMGICLNEYYSENGKMCKYIDGEIKEM